MEFKDVKIEPRDLMPAFGSPVISKNTELILEMTVLSFEVSLYPIEFLAMTKLFGKNNIEVVRISELSKDEVPDIALQEEMHRDGFSEYCDEICRLSGSERLICQYVITLKAYLTGKNILNACDGVTAEFFTKPENDGDDVTLLPEEDIMLKVILPRVYKYASSELFKTIGHGLTGEKAWVDRMWKPHRVMDNPVTYVDIPDLSSVILCCTGAHASVSFTSLNLAAEVRRYNEVPSGSVPYKYAPYNGSSLILCAKMTLIDFIDMVATSPSCFTIIDHDEIPSMEPWNYKFLEKCDALTRSYFMPSNGYITVVVKVNTSDKQGLSKAAMCNWYDVFKNTIENAMKVLKL